MKKNLLLAALCLIFAFLLYGCGSGTAKPETPVETPAPAETAETVPEGPVVEETAEPEESAAPTATLPDARLEPDSGEEDTGTSLFETAKTYVDKPFPELQEEIGEPLSSSYVSSCLIPGGEDGELQYDGFKVYTLKNGDSETVLDVIAD